MSSFTSECPRGSEGLLAEGDRPAMVNKFAKFRVFGEAVGGNNEVACRMAGSRLR
jgi:hypothetical protein